MIYLVYILAGLAGGVLTGMAGLTAAMVLTPILCGVCGWSDYILFGKKNTQKLAYVQDL